MVDIDGGYLIPVAFARDIHVALAAWDDHDFLRNEFQSLLKYTTISRLIAVNRARHE